MGVEVQDMDRAAVSESLNNRRVYGVVAADGYRHRSRRQNLAYSRVGVAVALRHIRVHDIGIADVDDAHLVIA